MSKVFVTGDTHGDIDFNKLTSKSFPEGRSLSKDDYVIICGDFGAVWGDKGSDRYLQKWYASKPWTTLFVDGNHENHDLLATYPMEIWHGGKVHRINKSIIHLMRGQIYEIGDRSIFTMGGAQSHDMEIRKAYVDWWPNEIPSCAEWSEAWDNLVHRDCNVDFIISHEAPAKVVAGLLGYSTDSPVAKVFNQFVDNIGYWHWYFGHYHVDVSFGKFTCCYNKVIRII